MHKVLLRGAGPLLLVVLAACNQSAQEPLSLDPGDAVVVEAVGHTFELRPGQTARVGSDGLLVGFRAVAQDSRCPVDVTCVWSGDARLQIPVTMGPMGWTTLELHTHVEPHSAQFRNYTITVLELRPEPREGKRIRTQDYVATLRVQ